MNYEKNLFKTKFGRRILIIFIACTILPLLALSVFVYHQITSDLRAQTLLRLKQITKSISMSVFERLLFLEAEMQLIGSQFARSMPADSYQSLLNANKAEFNQFKAMAIYDDQGNRVTLFGDTGKFPEYALLDKRVSETNKTTILTATENASIPTIFLTAPIIRTEHASRYMVGQASIENLSKILKENVIPAMTGFLILDAAGNVLISSEKSDEKIVAMMADLTRDRVSGHFIYNFKNKKYLAEFRKLFLRARYSVPGWTIILTQADDNVLQSVNEFKTFFPLIILFSFLIILLLSIQFVRRSLLPLEKLKKGTQRIVEGNFDDKVTIGSGDEFDDLADSFNKMAAKLHQQFNELRLTAAIGRFSSMIQDPDKLLQAIMDSIHKFLAFDRAALLLLNETKSRMIYKAGYGYTGRQKESLNITVKALRTVDPQDPIEQVLLTQKPQMTGSLFASESDRRASAKLAGDISPPTADNRGICIVIPIVYEKKSTGALLLEMEAALPNTMQLTFTPEFWVGLGSQIAVSLSNAASLQKIQESEERFRKSFDHAASGICLVSTDGQILTANNYLLKMLGYEEKELLAKSLEDISKQSHFMAEKSALKRLLKQEIEFDIYEKAYIHKKGHEIWGLVSISLLFNTSKIPLYYIMHIQNLSELKEAEKLQKELESRLREQQKKLHS